MKARLAYFLVNLMVRSGHGYIMYNILGDQYCWSLPQLPRHKRNKIVRERNKAANKPWWKDYWTDYEIGGTQPE